jgi:prevent-host-death family protein
MYIHFVAKQYSIAEARSSLPSIVDQAAAGEEIELTRRGKPVAVVMSVHEFERLRGGRVPFGDAFRRFTAIHPPQELGLDDDVFASARDRDPGRKVAL